jgi:hypothetical protein
MDLLRICLATTARGGWAKISFDPLKHICRQILLLMRSPFLFGYAKPVPVNFPALGRLDGARRLLSSKDDR